MYICLSTSAMPPCQFVSDDALHCKRVIDRYQSGIVPLPDQLQPFRRLMGAQHHFIRQKPRPFYGLQKLQNYLSVRSCLSVCLHSWLRIRKRILLQLCFLTAYRLTSDTIKTAECHFLQICITCIFYTFRCINSALYFTAETL